MGKIRIRPQAEWLREHAHELPQKDFRDRREPKFDFTVVPSPKGKPKGKGK